MSEYDLIVVGSGGGAMTGAAIAAKRGLSVLVLEKTAWLGAHRRTPGARAGCPAPRSSRPTISQTPPRGSRVSQRDRA
ncbi:MAG: FAD-binding protein [Marmoricola sp.]